MHNEGMTSDTPKQLALALAPQFKSAGLTQDEIAYAIGASQSQVSRVLSGHIKHRTKLFEKLCIYAKNQLPHIEKPDVRANSELMSALAEVWDGTEDHAQALAQVIRSLAQLHPVPTKLP
ncbi:helix-turn-helix domain-containing protein [Vogesella oryzae]|uniref:helix-turn-helix domain-containing protein n=1 Tax=Vogesella oryzae TaxID=1735285 RepID=UPI001C2EC3C7|nr:helix-turn-helix transcriptional regulator [Vogesella oryzae]